MIVSVRKFLFLVLMALALLVGTLGWTVRAMNTSLARGYYPSIQIHSQLPHSSSHVVCPPPPYDC